MNGSQINSVWMNVTTSASWSRPAVGIVRVEREICKALQEIYGERLRLCILKNGEFEPYVPGSLPSFSYRAHEKDDASWPTPFRDFPLTHFDLTSNLKPLDNHPDGTTNNGPLSSKETLSCFRYGDTLISVGLDWDWQSDRVNKFIYDLKIRRGMNIISCCYDLIPILYPQHCVGDVAKKFQEYFTNLAWRSSLILCISERTNKDYVQLVKNFGLPELPTAVIPLGTDLPEEGNSIGKKVEEILSEPFILFVSTIERRKNHEVLYRAYHLLRESQEDIHLPKLVFVGMPGWGVGDILKDIELDPLTKDYIVQLHHVNDAELRQLYEKCTFFVYPSLYEGWGLPVAEALAFGKAVLASDRGSIPEVGGDLVQYIDPWSAQAWADAISFLILHPAELERRSQNIMRHYCPRSWNETAAVVSREIENLYKNKKIMLDIEPGYQLHTIDGLKYGSRIVSVGVPGIVTRGLHYCLPSGVYQLIANVDKLEGSGGILNLRLAYAEGAEILADEIVEFSEYEVLDHAIEMKFNVPHEIEDFEIITQINSEMLISINNIKIELVTSKDHK